MDELRERIAELEAEIDEWKSDPDFYPWDSNYQRKLERLDELNQQYWAEHEAWREGRI